MQLAETWLLRISKVAEKYTHIRVVRHLHTRRYPSVDRKLQPETGRVVFKRYLSRTSDGELLDSHRYQPSRTHTRAADQRPLQAARYQATSTSGAGVSI